jgi:DNA ligase-1
LHLAEIVQTSTAVADASGRKQKIERIAACLQEASPGEVPCVVAWLSGVLPQGRIGVGPALIRDAMPTEGAPEASLTVARVDAQLTELADAHGAGSAAHRRDLLADLLAQATVAEQRFLAALLFGELRQGAQEGVMLEAIAQAAGVPAAAVRRAAAVSGDPALVAARLFEGGDSALRAFGLQLFQPLKPMLAQTAETVADAIERLGESAFEYKLDGTRIQVHRKNDEVRVYTRRLHDVTASVPEIVEAVLALSAGRLVLDGEAIALRADGTPLPFQETMGRFGTRTDVAAARGAIPLQCFFFDCLYNDDQSLVDVPAAERWDVLASVVPDAHRVPRIVTGDPARAEAFLREARETGHEGIMAKSLNAPWEAGARGRAWLKIKPANTLDLVVLAAEWGHGRRSGWLSNLHLGARDGSGGFVMLGKTFKGLTDVMLEWQTRELLALMTRRDRHVVHVRPELVVEIAFNEVQASSRYPGGLALRFARVKGYRPDKSVDEADGIDAVRAIHARTHPPGVHSD